MMRRIAVLDAPSNLGLRPPTVSSVPGCAKAPGALRDHDLIGRLGARDAGCLTPPRYDPGGWRPGDGVCHADEIGAYSMALAERVGAIIDVGEFPLVLGGDCSILLGAALAMHRLGEAVGGRIGLVYVDGHSDFRHPGNASYVGAAAGEGLALVTGRGQADLAAIEGRRPYFRDIDVVVLGIRAQDEYRLDLQAAGIVTRPAPPLRAEGAARSAQWAQDQLADCAGYWVHVDVDVLDPAVMPAVDAPDAGGIAFPELELLLAGLVASPHCLGAEITVFDPDYDPDGGYAAEIVATLVAGLTPLTEPEPAPAPVPRTPVSELAPALPRPPAGAAPSSAAPSSAAPSSPAGGVPSQPADAMPSLPAGGGPTPLVAPAAITVPERLARRRRSQPTGATVRPAGTAEIRPADDHPSEGRHAEGRRAERAAPAQPAGRGTAGAAGDAAGGADRRRPNGGWADGGRPSADSTAVSAPAEKGPVRHQVDGGTPDGRRAEGGTPDSRQAEPVGPPPSAGPGRLRRNPALPEPAEPAAGAGSAPPADPTAESA